MKSRTLRKEDRKGQAAGVKRVFTGRDKEESGFLSSITPTLGYLPQSITICYFIKPPHCCSQRAFCSDF